MKEIKNCPFCGGKAELIISDHECSDTTHIHKIHCENIYDCGANLVAYLSFYKNDYDEALNRFIDRWNRRANEISPEDGMSAKDFHRLIWTELCHGVNSCTECPFSSANNGAGINCKDFAAERTEQAVSILIEWIKKKEQPADVTPGRG